MMDPDFRQWVFDPRPESDLYWKTWIKNNPSQVKELLLAKELLLKLEFQEKSSGHERYDRILEKVLAGDYSDRSGKHSQDSYSLKPIGKYLRVAAVLLLAGFLFLYFYSNTVQEENLAVERELILKENPAGRKSQFFLPDGTVVWLNSESSLAYEVDSERKVRIVNLDGEAFFDVTKDKERPFIVKTSNCEVKVVGTQFNVKAYPEDPSHQVSLSEGIVSVQGVAENENDPVILQPGESLSVNEYGEKLKSTFDHQVTLGWRMGILHFEDASFQDVVNKLERWYGKDFLIEGDSKGTWKFTSEFHNETLENVLSAISYAKGFEYQINDKSVKLIFN